MDLALNNLRRLICYKIQTTNQLFENRLFFTKRCKYLYVPIYPDDFVCLTLRDREKRIHRLNPFPITTLIFDSVTYLYLPNPFARAWPCRLGL